MAETTIIMQSYVDLYGIKNETFTITAKENGLFDVKQEDQPDKNFDKIPDVKTNLTAQVIYNLYYDPCNGSIIRGYPPGASEETDQVLKHLKDTGIYKESSCSISGGRKSRRIKKRRKKRNSKSKKCKKY